MTCYRVLNQDGEIVAIVVKSADGTCIVHHVKTVFPSIDAIGRFFNHDGKYRLDEVKQ